MDIIFSSVLVHFLCKHVTIGKLLLIQRSPKQFAATPLQVSNAITSLLHLLHHLSLSAVLDWTCWQWGQSRHVGWIQSAKTSVFSSRWSNWLKKYETPAVHWLWLVFSFNKSTGVLMSEISLATNIWLLLVFWSNVCQRHINLVVLRC